MVKGIEKFKKFFEGFEDCYVVIGGTACEIHEELYAQIPRAQDMSDAILERVKAISAGMSIIGLLNRQIWSFHIR